MSKLKYKQHGFIFKILNLKPIVLISNLLFQGIRYMSFGEKIYKICFTLFFLFILNSFLKNILLSTLIAHLINYIFNGQFYVVFRYLSSKRTMSFNDLINFISLIERYIKVFNPRDILVIGSFSKGKMRSSSDLDIRLFHDNTISASFKAYVMANFLRSCGLFMKFPIDIFCFSDLKFLDKISKDEVPVNFLNDSAFLKKYPSSINYKVHIKNLQII